MTENDGRGRVEAAIDDLCARGSGLATFDADGVLWRGDVGNAFLLWQVENHRLSREAEREAREAWDLYLRDQYGELELAVLCAAVQRGLPEEQVAADAAAFIQREFAGQIVPEVREWVRRLRAAGVEVWVVSGSHRWLVQAGARLAGIPPDRLLAVENEVRDGVLTAEVKTPVTYAEGKADAIRQHLGRMPDLAAGNTYPDRFMLELARLPVAVEPDEALQELARQRGWPVVRFAGKAVASDKL